jgi:hypothetical protein
MRRIIVAAAFVAVAAIAHAETRMHATAHEDGSLSVGLIDEDAGRRMNTVLSPERTKQFVAYLTKHGLITGGNAAPEPKPNSKDCGLGDFFGGRC